MIQLCFDIDILLFIVLLMDFFSFRLNILKMWNFNVLLFFRMYELIDVN